MKNKIIKLAFCLGIGIAFLSCSNKAINSDVPNKIYFDTDLSIKGYDLKDLIDSTVTIIPLETNDQSLISAIEKIEIVDNCIYILDRLAQSIYIYNMEGKYIDKLSRRGQGPGEYANLSYMTVTDSTIIVIDHAVGKQIEYSRKTLAFLRDEHIFEKIWSTEVFTLPGRIYYINDWSNSTSGKYRLVSKEVDSNELEKYLPFDRDPLTLGIGGPEYGISENAASVIYSGDDIIYRVTKDGVSPAYEMVYKNDKVIYSSGRVENVFKDNPEGRVLGIQSINESGKYLFLEIVVTGNGNYTCIYDKQNSTTTIYDSPAINSYLDNEGVNIKRVINDQIINWQDAPTLFVLKEHVYAKKEFKNQKYKQQLDALFQDLTIESNPVLFLYNLK